jgi:hypothetical protein
MEYSKVTELTMSVASNNMMRPANTWTSRTVPNYSGGGPYTADQAWYDLIAFSRSE